MAKKKNYLIDMDGVLVKGKTPLPGAAEFIERLLECDVKFLILTNNPLYTQRDLEHRLNMSGLRVPADHIFTSAIATARFLQSQRPNGKAFVITVISDPGKFLDAFNRIQAACQVQCFGAFVKCCPVKALQVQVELVNSAVFFVRIAHSEKFACEIGRRANWLNNQK